jgi:hypothetical protein
MRFVALTLTLSLTGCFAKYKPEGPVISGWERTSNWSADEKSTARYTGQPVIASPVLPIMAFGAAYDLDLVLVSKHPDWDMHEYARLTTPDGPLWIAKESSAGTLDQYVAADIANIDTWMPEIPVERKQTEMEVIDQSTEEGLDLIIRYENLNGEPVEVVYQGDAPTRPQKKRNSSTFGHSRNQLIAALDVAHRESGFKASIRINDKVQRIEKIGGLLPFQFALEQVQGGMATAQFSIVEGDTVPWLSTVEEATLLSTLSDEVLAVDESATTEIESGVMVERGDGEDAQDAEGTGEADAAPESGMTVTKTDDAEEDATDEALPESGMTVTKTDVDDELDLSDDLLGDLDDEMSDIVEEAPTPGAIPNIPLADFSTVHTMVSGNKVQQNWRVEHKGSRVFATQDSPMRSLAYEYLVNGSALELRNIAVTQYGRPVPTTNIEISPALPDLRLPFSGRHTSRFVIDVNGQRNHAEGTIEAWWTEAGVKVKVVPESPDWTADRPLLTQIIYQDGTASVQIDRIE